MTPSLQSENLTEIAGMIGTGAALLGTAVAAFRRGKAAETAAKEAKRTTELEARKTRAQIEGVRKLSAPTGNGFAQSTADNLEAILDIVRKVRTTADNVNDQVEALRESTDHRLENLARSVSTLNDGLIRHLQSPHPTERREP